MAEATDWAGQRRTGIAAHRRVRPRRLLGAVLVYGVLILLAVVVLLPVLWMLSTALKPQSQIFAFPPVYIPHPAVWSNFVDALTAEPFALYARNTGFLVLVNVCGQVLSCTLIAYGFARLRFPGRGVLFMVMLATLLIPDQITMIPLFILYRTFGWVGTYFPLTVPSFFGNAFFVFLLRQYMMTLPVELDEAARLDGCNTWQILYLILLPLCWPPLTIIVVYTFTGVYNDFLAPLIYLSDPNSFTLAIGLANFVGRYATQWNYLMASSLVILIPLLVTYYFAQRHLIGGIASLGIKG
jgi:ABC-type glycerol-3-phosphate transport system permease component